MYLPDINGIHDFEGDAPELGWFELPQQTTQFPSTRFMGSKEKLLGPLWQAIGRFAPKRVLDLCSGSGVVSYMLKAQGCEVVSNDQMIMSTTIADALIANSTTVLKQAEIADMSEGAVADGKIWSIYQDMYFDRPDVEFLDSARLKINAMAGHKKSIARAALVRACLKRRPRGIFTYTGRRYDDGRKDLRLTLREHFERACLDINNAVFDNKRSSEVYNVDLTQKIPKVEVDAVYMDPPYYSPLSDNHYVRRYHFVEALARDWQGIEIQENTKTRKFQNYANPFAKESSCVGTMERVLDHFKNVPVIISYSTNSLPDMQTIKNIVRRSGRECECTEVKHQYSFGNQSFAKKTVRNKVKELIFTCN